MILLCSFCHVCTLFGSNTLQKIADDSVCHHCMRAIDVANGQEKKDFLKCAYCESVVHFECDGMGKDLREILESRDSIGYKCEQFAGDWADMVSAHVRSQVLLAETNR
mmetsp:Transcript_31182/g.81812  ORF Transcript_31182/g.81812 Transcript_31182/m.81812 type:complete len:108 (-) Transcript_31182:515-838(-)